VYNQQLNMVNNLLLLTYTYNGPNVSQISRKQCNLEKKFQ